jgi:type II secretory pathway pseudopilin PulG
MRRRVPSQRGFILVETVFAIAIVATAVATAAGAISVSARVMDKASARTTAAWIAVSQAESIREGPFVSTLGVNVYPTVTTPTNFSVTNETLQFQSESTASIQYVDITVRRNSATVLTNRIVKVNR